MAGRIISCEVVPIQRPLHSGALNVGAVLLGNNHSMDYEEDG